MGKAVAAHTAVCPGVAHPPSAVGIQGAARSNVAMLRMGEGGGRADTDTINGCLRTVLGTGGALWYGKVNMIRHEFSF